MSKADRSNISPGCIMNMHIAHLVSLPGRLNIQHSFCLSLVMNTEYKALLCNEVLVHEYLIRDVVGVKSAQRPCMAIFTSCMSTLFFFFSDLGIATTTSNWFFLSRSHCGSIIFLLLPFFFPLSLSLLSCVFVVKLHAKYEPLVRHSPHGAPR